MTDGSQQEAKSTSQQLHDTVRRQNRRGEKMTPKQKKVAAAVRRLGAEIKAEAQTGAELSTEKQVKAALVDLYTKLDEGGGSLSIEEEKEVLEEIGKPIGKRLIDAILKAGRKATQTTVEALPATVPLSFFGAELAHKFAVSYPEVMRAFVEGDEAALIAVTLGFLSIRGIIQEKKPIEPIIREFQKQMELFRQNPPRKSIQATLFGAACLGAILTAADPEGVGNTIAPILGSVAALQFIHSFTEMATGDVLLDIARRQEEGAVVDITDPSLLAIMGLTEIKKIAKRIVGGVTHAGTIVRRLKTIDRKRSESDIVPHGFSAELAEAILLGYDENGNGGSPSRGGNTSRQIQDPEG